MTIDKIDFVKAAEALGGVAEQVTVTKLSFQGPGGIFNTITLEELLSLDPRQAMQRLLAVAFSGTGTTGVTYRSGQLST